MGPPYGKRDPYYSHTTPIFESLKIWEWYGKLTIFGGPMSLGVPENPIDKRAPMGELNGLRKFTPGGQKKEPLFSRAVPKCESKQVNVNLETRL